MLNNSQTAKRACTSASRATMAQPRIVVKTAAVEAPSKPSPIIMDGQVLHSITKVRAAPFPPSLAGLPALKNAVSCLPCCACTPAPLDTTLCSDTVVAPLLALA